MNTKEIADRLVELCRQGKYKQAQQELFATNAKSIEPPQSPGAQSVEGLDNIIKKGEEFERMLEAVHGGHVSDPIVAGNCTAFGISIDATMKGTGRTKIEEIALYEVKDGKIVQEQFFY